GTPAVILSCGSIMFRCRPTNCDAHSPELAITCIVPIALAGDTAVASKPDSICACASASEGSTPIELGVERTISRIWLRDGICESSSARLLSFAFATTSSGYVLSRNVSPTSCSSLPDDAVLVELEPEPPSFNVWPARMMSVDSIPLAFSNCCKLRPFREATPDKVSPDLTL